MVDACDITRAGADEAVYDPATGLYVASVISTAAADGA